MLKHENSHLDCSVFCQEFIHRKLRRTGAQDFRIDLYFTFVIHVAILGSIHDEMRFFLKECAQP